MICGQGEVTLGLGGQASVPLARMPAGAKVLLTPRSLLGTVGTLTTTVTERVGFSIASANILDRSVVGWVVIV